MSTVKVVRPADAVMTLHGAGDEYRYLVTGLESNGAYFVMEALVPPGGGPPPHIQTREEEGFYILEGVLTFWTGEEEIEAGPGTFLHVPRGAPHNFRNESNRAARMLIVFAPAGIESMMEKMAADPDRYIEIGKQYGVEFLDEI